MSMEPDYDRLQKLFRQLDGGGTPQEIANAVGMINRHLAPSGKRLRDLTVTDEIPASLDTATVLRDAEDVLRKNDELLARINGTDPYSRTIRKNLRRAEIQRDVLATFLSERVLSMAQLQAESIIARVEKGADVANDFGRPGWANKAGSRPDRHWGY